MAKSLNWETEEDNIIKSLMMYKFNLHFFIENKMKNIFGHK